ncbi:STM4014 family protein [Streptomyces qinzhouensis]|uniref:STM4014 family protein n=1 Tax=Streptomyces qinzhouensis TaxID=2599401 RepID=UPI001644DDED|nr:STM4014 family protein [Streptomyces qinzhouensis]
MTVTTSAPVPPRDLRIALVGAPEGRRVALFREAARAAGLPPVRVVPWADALSGRAEFRRGEWVRIESPGEDPGADAILRGGGEPTRVEGSGRWYTGFVAAVREVSAAVTAAGAVALDDPDQLAVLFDKRLCHGALRDAGVPVPESPTSGAQAPPVRGWDDVRTSARGAGPDRIFVKLAHGSSASGVLAVETASGGRVRATTSVERDDRGRLFNSLRVRRYTRETEIAAIVDALAPDGLHIERWLPKAHQNGRSADLRIVVTDGRATHAVLRTSRSPMTNLHLGGARGDLAAARAAIDRSGGDWADALAICERAADRFPGALRVGVDLLPLRGWRTFAVGEVNAFGDLLPGLLGLPDGPADGLDTYGAQLAALRRRTAGPGAPPPTVPPDPRPHTAPRDTEPPSTAPRAGNDRAHV